MTLLINGSFLSQHQSGVQRYATEITKRLILSHDSRLIVKNPELANGYPQESLKIVPPGFFSRRLPNFWALYDIQANLKKSDVLWHPANIAMPIYGKHIVTIHDMSVFAGPEWFTRSFLAKYYALLPIVAARASHILTVSEFSKEQIMRYLRVKENRISIGYNGVGESFRSPQPEVIERVRKKYSLSKNYVLSVGTLEPRKNLKTLIEAWKMSGISTSHDLVLAGAKVHIFSGAGIDEYDLEQSKIRLLGYIDDEDLPALYTAASGFVYLSLYEGFGLPVLEALACGCCVLASDIPVFRELFKGDLLLTDHLDVISVSESLRMLISSPVKPPSRDNLERRFNWGNTSQVLVSASAI
jgi:glycosyltransferase involved in cell wall biosynthesis